MFSSVVSTCLAHIYKALSLISNIATTIGQSFFIFTLFFPLISLSLLWQNTRHKQLKEERIWFCSQLLARVHHCRKSMVAGVGGRQLHCIHSQKPREVDYAGPTFLFLKWCSPDWPHDSPPPPLQHLPTSVWDHSGSSLLLFTWPPVSWPVLPTFKESIGAPVKPPWKCPDRPTQRFIS